jgi:hypothetical protein
VAYSLMFELEGARLCSLEAPYGTDQRCRWAGLSKIVRHVSAESKKNCWFRDIFCLLTYAHKWDRSAWGVESPGLHWGEVA